MIPIVYADEGARVQLINDAIEVIKEQARRSLFGKALWSSADGNDSEDYFKGALRIWADTAGNRVVVCLTASPRWGSEQLTTERAALKIKGDSRAIERLMQFLTDHQRAA